MADNGVPVSTDFLNPEEQYRVGQYLHGRAEENIAFWGGWEEAERRKLFFFPEWFSEQNRRDFMRQDTALIRITGSGYEELNHRAFLGAVLALGLKRECIGDIVMEDSRHAVLFCDPVLLDFFAQEPCPLQSVGRDRVQVECPAHLERPLPPRRYADIYDTVASPRLDCVAAALIRLSRDKTQTLIRNGDVFLNYRAAMHCDEAVKAEDVISIRRFGKFRIDCLAPKPKGGRLRLLARKYM